MPDTPAATTPPSVFDLDPPGLGRLIESWGWPAYRTEQILHWVYREQVVDPAEMTNLSQADRCQLASGLAFLTTSVTEHQSAEDGTQKLLLHVPATDAKAPPAATECVMIPADEGTPRRTACVSSQVGCPVGCRFCASGIGGLEANLSAGQILEQVWHLNRLPQVAVTHVVFMGMGEPLCNYQNVVAAIRGLTAPWGFGLSARRITLSTVGLPAQIRRLADQLNLPVTLAISLHAPTDALRQQIIPWAERTPIAALVDAGRYYFQQTGREVTLEYILLGGVNDRPQHARELAEVARKLRSNVNLIGYNPVAGLPFKRPQADDIMGFQRDLRQRGVNVHVRASRGRDIAAACGQLRHENASTGDEPSTVGLRT